MRDVTARPDPVRWLWYAFGGGLPARYREWVLRDTTGRTWALRHMLRGVVQVTPVALVLVVALGWSSTTALAVLAGLLLSMIYSVAYLEESAEHRLAKADYPAGTGRSNRQRADVRRTADTEHYHRQYRTPPGS